MLISKVNLFLKFICRMQRNCGACREIQENWIISVILFLIEEWCLRSVRRLLVAACVVPSSPIFVTLMKEAPGSSET
jgi:hypothetical protein